jgi:hypothetical protein
VVQCPNYRNSPVCAWRWWHGAMMMMMMMMKMMMMMRRRRMAMAMAMAMTVTTMMIIENYCNIQGYLCIVPAFKWQLENDKK